LEPLRSAAEALGGHPRDERLVLLASTVPPGTTREFAGWIERSSSELFVAHGPERLSVGHDWRTLRRIPHLVGGLDPSATTLAARLLSELCDTVVPVSGPEVSELSKLLENAFLTVGIGLVGEIARIAHALDVSAREVTDAAATKTSGYHAFHPGPGVGGHCLRNDLEMLRHTARKLGWRPSLIDATAEVTEAHPRLVVDRLAALLSGVARRLEGSRILLVGMGFKVGTADTSASPAYDVVRLLRHRGAVPDYLDSRVAAVNIDGQAVERVSNTAVIPGRYAAVIVLAGDPALSADVLRSAGCLVLDTGGGVVLSGEPRGFLSL
jgi:UDP-N-acetyl-D-glucosamine dehydrogenase